jgi:hypothetical protein
VRDDSNSSEVLGARAGLGVAIGANWRIDVTGFAQRLDVHDSQYVYSPGARSRSEQIAVTAQQRSRACIAVGSPGRRARRRSCSAAA